MKKSTSWGTVAHWYDDYLENSTDTYQRQVILPNLSRLMDIKSTDTVLDLACGSGFFSCEFLKATKNVIGADISGELIAIAKNKYPTLTFYATPADKLGVIKNESIDKLACVLAIQNIENVKGVFEEVKRVLKQQGSAYFVLNHPAFRIPKASSWGFDDENKDGKTLDKSLGKQYRRIDQYLSEKKVTIDMNPGFLARKNVERKQTISFHRPLQYYAKLLHNSGFAMTRLEEWISHKESEPGPRQKEENRIRKEIPLFLCIEVKKTNL